MPQRRPAERSRRRPVRTRRGAKSAVAPTAWGVLAACLALLWGCTTVRSVGAPLTPWHEQYVQRSTRRAIAAAGPAADDSTMLVADVVVADTDPLQAIRRPLTLWEAIGLSLGNTAVIHQDAQFLSTSNALHFNVEASPSALDTQIQGASINFGDRGVAGALSDFAPRLSGHALWGRDEQVQNDLFTVGLPPGAVFTDESSDVLLRLEKTMAWGGEFAIENRTLYSGTNQPAQLFPSAYDGSINFRYTQPLWAGAGTEFTQIAGPASALNPRVLSVNQGVVIARINGRLEQLAFQESLNRLIKDVTDVYWELSLAHQALEVSLAEQQRLEEIWERTQVDLETGRGSAALEAAVADSHFAAVAQVENASASLSAVELRLRRLLGLPSRDGTLLVPVDSPVTAVPETTYEAALTDALQLRPELERSKWQLRSLTLQHQAAKKLIAPRLDLQAGYQVNGFGDRLISRNTSDGRTAAGYRSYYSTLFQGDQTGWDLGVVLDMPIGFVQERAQARNLELRMVKAQASIAAQEQEISRELINALEWLKRARNVLAASASRLAAAERRLAAVEADYEVDRLDPAAVVDARSAHSRASMAHREAVIQLTRATGELLYRQGRILDAQHISLQFPIESNSPPDAAAIVPPDAVSGQGDSDAAWKLVPPSPQVADRPAEGVKP